MKRDRPSFIGSASKCCAENRDTHHELYEYGHDEDLHKAHVSKTLLSHDMFTIRKDSGKDETERRDGGVVSFGKMDGLLRSWLFCFWLGGDSKQTSSGLFLSYNNTSFLQTLGSTSYEDV